MSIFLLLKTNQQGKSESSGEITEEQGKFLDELTMIHSFYLVE